MAWKRNNWYNTLSKKEQEDMDLLVPYIYYRKMANHKNCINNLNYGFENLSSDLPKYERALIALDSKINWYKYIIEPTGCSQMTIPKELLTEDDYKILSEKVRDKVERLRVLYLNRQYYTTKCSEYYNED